MQNLVLGEGVELSAVCHYALNKANARGEWMTQWLLENKLVALNTRYKKIPPEADDLPQSDKRRETAGLHLAGQKTSSLEQRC